MNKEIALDIYYHTPNQKIVVGKCIQKNREIYFEYSKEFIETGIELSPIKLPLSPLTYVDKQRVFDGLPGLLYDSLPDGWGLLLMDRYFQSQGVEYNSISPLERLAFMGERSLGALSYQPTIDMEYEWDSNIGLELLAKHCEVLLHGREDHVLSELIIAGGSPGGARPKVIVGYNEHEQKLLSGTSELPENFDHYLIKFSAMIDVNDNAEVEYAYSLMANDCGINMPPTKLFDAGKYGAAFGIARFDRRKNQKIHMHTLSGLLHANFRIPNLDYTDFLKATWILTQNRQDVLEGFRRMVFNVLTHNRDDHSKNFSFLYQDNTWRLSPAYDLTFTSGVAGEHTMTIAGSGLSPNRENFLQVAKTLDITQKESSEIIEQVQSVTSQWNRYASQANVDSSIAQRVAKVLANIAL